MLRGAVRNFAQINKDVYSGRRREWHRSARDITEIEAILMLILYPHPTGTFNLISFNSNVILC